MNGFRDLINRPKGTVPGLDALRSLAILLVVSGHFSEGFSAATGTYPLRHFPLYFFGWTGVDLFFVLSGYLIGRQIWKELRETGGIQVGRFLLRRGFRIWPLYFAVLVFYVVFLGRSSLGFGAIAPDLFFLSNYFPGQVSGGWSLSTEEQFYIFVPLSILLVNRFVRLERQWLFPVLLLIALPVIRAVSPADNLYTPFHTHCDGLVMGLLIAWASVAKPAILEPHEFWLNTVIPTAAIVVGVAIRQFNKTLFAFSALAMIFGGMTLFTLRDQTWVRKALSWPGFYVISRLSYGMYLNHFEIIGRLTPLIARPGPVGMILGNAAAIAVSMAVAVLTFVLIESPFLALREKYLRHS